jgi:hypothetical protein
MNEGEFDERRKEIPQWWQGAVKWKNASQEAKEGESIPMS